MSEEITGTETTGDAGQTKDVSTPVDEKKEEGMMEAYKAEKEKRQSAETEVELLQNQIALAAANRVPVTQAQPQSAHDQAIRDLGLQDVLWPDAAQQSQIEARKEQIMRSQVAQDLAYSAGKSFIESHSDYSEVVGIHPPQGGFIPSKEMKEILKEKPYLRASAYQGPSAAYKVVMDHRREVKREAELAALQEHNDAQAIDDNLKPMSPGSKGGGSTTTRTYKTAEEVRQVELEIEQGMHG